LRDAVQCRIPTTELQKWSQLERKNYKLCPSFNDLTEIKHKDYVVLNYK
jgi:hypothetical protein